MIQWPKSNDVLGTTNRGNPAESGLCTLCRSDCAGKCETWMSCLKGRHMLYPRDFGSVTAGSANTCHVGVSYNSLRIQGFSYGAQGVAQGRTTNPDDCLFTNVSLETAFGAKEKTKVRLPLMTGALGSTFIAAKYWDSFAAGCALVGIPIVVGENVVGVDREAEFKNGRVSKAPELERRIETYMRYYDGYGAIIVQLNVEDTRNGVAEYLVEKYGDKVILELKWGQGAKCIGGEIKIDSLERALELQRRGYCVTPDPSDPAEQAAFKDGALKAFERHSRLGFIDQAGFMAEVERLRGLGAKRVSLKTGAYQMRELAMAIKWASDARLDLLTIDGASGGTGMSPWRMMMEWGVPTFYIQSMTNMLVERLRAKGGFIPDIAIAGGLSTEDHIFKVLAMGAPHTVSVCMGRALMIPGMVGKNIAQWIVDGDLPKTVSQFGSTKEEIFVCYEDLVAKVGKETADELPLGALGLFTFSDKIKVGLQQLMAGSRNFRLDTITRDDVFALTEEAAKVSGLPYVMDVQKDLAFEIIDG